MKAALYRAFGAPLDLTELPDPEPAADGAVIEVRACGVCRSDWHAWMGHDPTVRLPHVPGHELAGVVRAVGAEVRTFAPGDRVTVPFCCGCGRCPECTVGRHNLCHHEYQPGFDGWGAFAEYVAVPHADVNLVRLPDALEFVAAAALGCRVVTAFGGLVDRAALAPGEWLAVHGCGGVGLAAVMIGRAVGARVIAVDIVDEKLELARTLGAEAAVNAHASDAATAVHELTQGGAHVSVDALGSAATSAASIRSLRRRGRHLQLGLLLADDADPKLPLGEVIKYELSILGGHGLPAHRYGALLAMIAGGQLDPGRLVGKRLPLAEAGRELAAMGRFGPRGVSVIDRF